MRSVKFLLCYCREWRRGDMSSGILARCMSSERRISPEMPAPVTKSRYFCRAPQRSVRGLRDRSGEPLKSGRLALLEASRIPLWFPLHRLPSIVDATPPPPPHHHRSLPTGCPRRPARHPSRRRTQQHPPLHVAASSRRNAATAAADARRRDAQRQQCPPHATPPAPHTQQQTPLENRHYAGS